MNGIDKLADVLVNSIKRPDNKPKPKPYDTPAEVRRVEGDTAFVHIPGGVDETPVKLTINAKAGDSVQVRVSGGRAFIIGNQSAPPTDDTTATYVQKQVVELNNSFEADIGNLKANKADISELEANYAHISNGVIDNAKIGYADVNDLNAHYANIDLANVNNAWIQNGVIKDAAIADAQIIGVGANKITAGVIDASKITVTNLNADNITAGTINGQRIGTGSLSLDKLSEEVPTKEYLDDLADNLQGQIDGQIETWTGTTVPTLNNAPAVDWKGDAKKLKAHVGDIYYVVNAANDADGYTYRFTESGSGLSTTYSWTLIKDNQITKALQEIQEAKGDISGIKQFDNEISSWKTDTDEEISSLKGRTTTLETDMGTKVSTQTFNELSQTVDENSASITSLSDVVETKADGSTVQTLSNTVNTVKQTADTNKSNITNLTKKVDDNETDIEQKYSDLTQDLNGFKTTVGSTYHKISDFNTYKTANDAAVAAAKKAGDDAQANLDDYKDTVEETYATKSSVTQTANSIRQDVESSYTKTTTFNNYKSSNDAAVAAVASDLETVKTTYVKNSTFETTTEQIRGEVSAVETTTKSYTDGKISQEVTDRNSAINQKADAITASVSSTYATKDSLESAKSEIKATTDGISTEVAKKTDKASIISTIRQSAESVKIKASQVEIDGTATFNAIKAKTDAAYDVIGAASTALNNLQIGGRNLVWDTEWKNISTRWSDWGSPTTREIVTANGKRWLHLVTTASLYQGYSQAQDKRNGYGEIKAGDKVVISYSAYAKTAGQICTVGCHWRNSSGAIVSQNWFPSTLTTTEKRYTSAVFTIPNNAVGFNVMVGDGTTNAQELWISQVKIEFGTKATDWTPAPEDVQAEIDTKRSTHTLMSSNTSGTSYSTILGYAAEGHSEGWNVISTEGVRKGDTVRIGYYVSDMNKAVVYLVGTVTSVDSATHLTMISHGLDTTVIDGGNILTNSIGANKIKVSELTIGQSQVNGLSTALAGKQPTGDYATKSQAQGYSSAAETNAKKVATNYIYAGSGGIKIANADPEHADTYQKQTADSTEFYVDGVKRSDISGNGMRVYDNDGVESASFGRVPIIGKSEKNHLQLDDDSVDFMDGDTLIGYVGSDSARFPVMHVQSRMSIGDKYELRVTPSGSLGLYLM